MPKDAIHKLLNDSFGEMYQALTEGDVETALTKMDELVSQLDGVINGV